MTIAVVVSMTNHANFFHLRDHPMAEPNVQVLAKLTWEAFNQSTPAIVPYGGWHLPFVDEDREMYSSNYLRKLAAARCARVSYLTHEGTRDAAKDLELHDRLVGQKPGDPMHASPLEHPAMAVGKGERHGNFVGWKQYRKFFANEAGPLTMHTSECCGLWYPNQYNKRHTDGCRIVKGMKK
jgi:thymidylate synthase ThyX